MCSDEKALEISEKMDLLRQYPRETKARAVIAEMIQELCQSDRDADRLFRETREAYNSWPGPQEFATFARGKMRPQAQRPELQEWEREQLHHEPDCKRCRDNGFIQHQGVVKRCDCEAGRTLPEKVLKLAQGITVAVREGQSDKPRRSDSIAKVTAADIAAVMRQKRERSRK